MGVQRHVSAGMIVFTRDNGRCRFLLVLSRLTKKPLWEFPKGGVDPGETLLQTALRELREETGITEADLRIIPDFSRAEDYRFTSGRDGERGLVHKRVTYFLAETTKTDIVIAASEISESAWVELPEAEKRLRYAERKRLIRDAAQAIGCDSVGNEITQSIGK